MKDDNFFGIENSEGEEEGVENFNIALEKKQFQGKKGKMLLELQKSYKNDQRFVLNKNFKDDIEVAKVPKNLKFESNAFEENEKDKIKKEKVSKEQIDIEIKEEKNKNFNILANILSNEEFLKFNNKKPNNPKNLLIKRFDPSLNLGKELVKEIKPKEAPVKEKPQKNTMKLEKGVNKLPNQNNKAKDFNKLNSKEKDYAMQKVMDEANKIQETKIEINYKSLQNIFNKTDESAKQENNFLLFSNGNDEELIKKVNVNKKSKAVKTKAFELFNGEPTENKEETVEDNDVLNKKRQRTKIKNQQKKLKKQKQKEEQRKKEVQASEDIEKKFKQTLLENNDQEKVNEYLRLINLVKTKGKIKK
jgi:hypothetical protein